MLKKLNFDIKKLNLSFKKEFVKMFILLYENSSFSKKYKTSFGQCCLLALSKKERDIIYLYLFSEKLLNLNSIDKIHSTYSQSNFYRILHSAFNTLINFLLESFNTKIIQKGNKCHFLD